MVICSTFLFETNFALEADPPLNLSIRFRLLLTASLTLSAFAILFVYAQTAAFSHTLEDNIQQRLAADARTVLASARFLQGELVMPSALSNPRFNQVESDLVALIYDSEGGVVWRSSSSGGFQPSYRPHYNEGEVVFLRLAMPEQEHDYYIYDWDIELGDRAYSIITGIRSEEFDANLRTYQRQLRLWLIAGLGGLLMLLSSGLMWTLRPLRRLYRQVLAVERGHQAQLHGDYPAELERLTVGLNRLLVAQRSRQQRYQASLADLAHGLKTPLAVVNEASRNLCDEERHVMQEQVQIMNQLVSFHLQRATPLSAGWVISPLPLAPVLEKLCSSLGKVYRDKNVSWKIDLDQCEVLISEAEALELFGNLLENAFRLCLREVRIGASRVGVNTVVRVEDDGPGVPEDQREKILERGGRADSQHPGQGIGLALVTDMLSEMDGSLSIESSELGGAAFCVTLPAMIRRTAWSWAR